MEERLGAVAAAERQFVWGLRYVDDLLLRDRGCERLYSIQDANWNVTALSDSAGDVVERYHYSAYGEPEFFTGAFALAALSSYDVETLYCGYRWDSILGSYSVRNRVLWPHLGRWDRRDPIGFAVGLNLYEYSSDSPLGGVDPSGLATVCCTRWTRRLTTLGYAHDQIGGLQCILSEVRGGSFLNKQVAIALIALGATTRSKRCGAFGIR